MAQYSWKFKQMKMGVDAWELIVQCHSKLDAVYRLDGIEITEPGMEDTMVTVKYSDGGAYGRPTRILLRFAQSTADSISIVLHHSSPSGQDKQTHEITLTSKKED